MNRFDVIVDRIYEAALDDAVIPAMLRDVTHWLDAVGIDMSILSRRAGIVTNYTTLDDACIGEYVAHYYTVNPRLERAFRYPPGTLFTDRMMMSAREIARSEFHQDYLSRYALGDFMGTILTNDKTMWSYAALVYDATRGEPGRDVLARYRRLAPHLRRLTRLRRALAETRLQLSALETATRELPLGIVLLDADWRIRFMNAAAERVIRLGDCVSMRDGRLVEGASANGGELAAALQAAQARPGEGGGPGTVLLSRGAGCQSLELYVLRLPVALRGDAHHTAVFITDPADNPVQLGTHLARRFGLTPSETALALDLMDGTELAGIAERRSVAVSTLRTQLSALLAKTATRRQGELIAALWRASLALRQLPRA
ncbi:MAG: helix-turn-helix transcriptional regulator [Gammaproteobacteria bacterium]